MTLPISVVRTVICISCSTSPSSLKQLRNEVQTDDASTKKKELQEKGTGSYGYGGKFGVQKDRMDKVCE